LRYSSIFQFLSLGLLLVIVDRKRSVESPDRADALIGAVMLGIGSDPYAVNPGAREQMLAAMQQASQQMECEISAFAKPFVDWNRVW
jgi:hypothetical protein